MRFLPALLFSVAVVAAGCSGSQTTRNGGDAAATGPQGDAAADDVAAGGMDGGGSSGGSSSSGAGSSSGGRSSSGGDAATDGASSAVQCGPGTTHSFPTFDRHCTTDADCTLAVHTLSCCGNVLVMGINKDAATAFQTAEATCNSQYPACGCSSNAVGFEDGVAYGQASSPTQAAAARCVNSSCFGAYTGTTFACGSSEVCATGADYCQVQAPADGAPPDYSCSYLGQATDAGVSCSSFAISPGCTCATSQGNATVTCH
ncbi:MAG: hypothetical protein ACRENE_13635 [Polyangiaceae bacterium]